MFATIHHRILFLLHVLDFYFGLNVYNFVFVGKSKAVAKSATSEAVIKYLFMKKVKKMVVQNNINIPQQEAVELETDVRMEDEEEDELFSWSHVASFAIYKLLSTWDDGSVMNSINTPSVEKVSKNIIKQ